MLGRLRMSVDDAIRAYAKLSKKVFSEVKWVGDGKYKATRLEAAVKEIVKEYTGNAETGILEYCSTDDCCRTYVLYAFISSLNLVHIHVHRIVSSVPSQRPT